MEWVGEGWKEEDEEEDRLITWTENPTWILYPLIILFSIFHTHAHICISFPIIVKAKRLNRYHHFSMVFYIFYMERDYKVDIFFQPFDTRTGRYEFEQSVGCRTDLRLMRTDPVTITMDLNTHQSIRMHSFVLDKRMCTLYGPPVARTRVSLSNF